MARAMPARAAPSPSRDTRPANQPSASRVMCSDRERTLPVRISAQVEALTKKESDAPACSVQLPSASLSARSSSAVRGSGTRSSDSARHMRAMPSSLERPKFL